MILRSLNMKVEKKHHVTGFQQFITVLIAFILALFVTFFLIYLAGEDVLVAGKALFSGAFGSWRSFAETLVKSTPLILAGLSITIAFRAKIWNIGAEGQIFAGAIAAYWVIKNFGHLPSVTLISLVIVASLLGGGIWGFIPGYLKVKYNVDEIVVTVMMNYIIVYALSFLLSGIWQDPSSAYLQSSRIPEAAYFPILFQKTRVHLGFLFSIIMAILLYFFLWRTPVGYEIRAIGLNSKAAKFKGIDVNKTIVLTMIISGAIAGLAGAGEVAGIHHRLRMDITTGYGFVGIIIALMARLHPLTVILVAILFGGLENGVARMQIYTGIPVALVHAIQSIILLFVITADILSKYRLKKLKEC